MCCACNSRSVKHLQVLLTFRALHSSLSIFPKLPRCAPLLSLFLYFSLRLYLFIGYCVWCIKCPLSKQSSKWFQLKFMLIAAWNNCIWNMLLSSYWIFLEQVFIDNRFFCSHEMERKLTFSDKLSPSTKAHIATSTSFFFFFFTPLYMKGFTSPHINIYCFHQSYYI